MKLDLVHDIQSTYRLTLDAMSRPGKIVSLSSDVTAINDSLYFFPSTWLLIHMLLDIDVTFNVISSLPEEKLALMNQLTYAKPASMHQADYIFVSHDANNSDVHAAIEQVKNGSLVDPHESATVIIEVEALSTEAYYELRGPGIKSCTYINIHSHVEWQTIREQRNIEYPLGIDLIFVDRKHQLIALPRTTQVTRSVNMQ